LSGCLCRCTGYQQIFEAVEAAIANPQSVRNPQSPIRHAREAV